MKMANMRFALCALLCFAVADSAQEEDPGTIAGDDAYPAQTCDEWCVMIGTVCVDAGSWASLGWIASWSSCTWGWIPGSWSVHS